MRLPATILKQNRRRKARSTRHCLRIHVRQINWIAKIICRLCKLLVYQQFCWNFVIWRLPPDHFSCAVIILQTHLKCHSPKEPFNRQRLKRQFSFSGFLEPMYRARIGFFVLNLCIVCSRLWQHLLFLTGYFCVQSRSLDVSSIIQFKWSHFINDLACAHHHLTCSAVDDFFLARLFFFFF